VSTLRQASGQIAQERLCTPELSGLERRHRRSDDRDLQWLCWM
jgi:hypothetical protein